LVKFLFGDDCLPCAAKLHEVLWLDILSAERVGGVNIWHMEIDDQNLFP
jgi:hypothetical protein